MVKEAAEGWLFYTVSRVDRFFNTCKLPEDLRIEVQKRVKICAVCPELEVFIDSPKMGKCKKCNCSFPMILYSRSKSCPIGKWDSIPK